MLDSGVGRQELEGGFLVGDYLVEPELQRISRGGVRTTVEPKVMDVLLCLAVSAGRTVPKERFMSEVWGGTIVTDDALLRCISELRKLFGDDTRRPAYVETIRKKGYRLIAPVRLARKEVASERTSTLRRARPLLWVVVALAAVLIVVALTLEKSDVAPVDVHPLRTVPMTSYPGEESDPSLSPDGERVAFVWDAGIGGAPSIYV